MRDGWRSLTVSALAVDPLQRTTYARTMPAADPATRRAIATTAGRARAQGDPAELLATRRAAAAAVNSPAALARRIVRRWPDLTRAERAEVRAILAPLMPRGRPIGGQ